MMKATISIKTGSPRISRSLAKSIEPDNLSALPSVRIRTRTKRDIVVSSVVCSKSLETLIATIDDLLVCMDAAYKTLEIVKDEERA